MPSFHDLHHRARKLRHVIAVFRKIERDVNLLCPGSTRDVAADQVVALTAMSAASIEVLLGRLAETESELSAKTEETNARSPEDVVTFPEYSPFLDRPPRLPSLERSEKETYQLFCAQVS